MPESMRVLERGFKRDFQSPCTRLGSDQTERLADEELWGPRILTSHRPSVILCLLMGRGYVIGVLIVAGLVFLAPVAMAFGGCAAMTAMCEGPCGASSCGVMSTAPHSIWLGPVADLAPEPPEPLPTANLSSPDPPPKPILLSA